MYGDRFDGENGNETGITVLPPETYIDLTVLTTGETSSISHVMDLIAGIGKVTLESRDSIQAAREAYEALPENLQPYVTNYSSLTAAEAEYQALSGVFSLISEIGEVTYSKADVIDQAREAYDALSVGCGRTSGPTGR